MRRLMAADELVAEAPAVGIRQGGERRKDDRRAVDRGTRNRRRRERRGAALRHMLLSALAFAMPHQVAKQEIVAARMPRVLTNRPGPRVTVSINSFEPGDRTHAFD